MIILALIILGLILGSFINALVWRLHENELRAESMELRATKTKKKPSEKDSQLKASANLSIWTGRSQCVHCGHPLGSKDLVPVLSWFMLRGKCRYCHKPISSQYPVVELATAAVFALSYIFWPIDLDLAGHWLLLVTWLSASVGLIALMVYDFKWLLLPNRLIYPTLLVAAAGRLAYVIFYELNKSAALLDWALAISVASGIFLLIFLVSKGRWIGYGDVRLGLITGTLIADPGKAVLMIFLASVLALLVSLPLILRGKEALSAKIPFGPYLIVATGIVVLWGNSLINWYLDLVHVS